MLKGIDISHYQTNVSYNNYDFVIMKATEGKTYKDPMLDKHYDGVNGSSNGKPNKEKLYGFYHYARPENNSYKDEAENFLKYVKHHAGNCIYALDWEGTALNYPVSWALSWLDYVYQKTGVKSLLYTQQSQAKLAKYDPIIKADYGLWVARYNKEVGDIRWPVWAMWQYTDKPIDHNYFNGTKEQFRKYCRKV